MLLLANIMLTYWKYNTKLLKYNGGTYVYHAYLKVCFFIVCDWRFRLFILTKDRIAKQNMSTPILILQAIDICFYKFWVNTTKIIYMKVNTENGKVEVTEAVDQRCSVKKVFRKYSQNWQENTSARISFLRVCLGLQLIKKEILAQVLPVIFVIFPYRTPLVAASEGTLKGHCYLSQW